MSIFKLPSFLKRKPPAPVEEQSHFQGVKKSDPAPEEVGEPILSEEQNDANSQGEEIPVHSSGTQSRRRRKKAQGQGDGQG